MAEALPPLEANFVSLADPDDDDIGIYLPEDDDDIFAMLPPDFATVGAMGTEPASIDEALRGPNAKEWQAALDYEISQLEKLGVAVLPSVSATLDSLVIPLGRYGFPHLFLHSTTTYTLVFPTRGLPDPLIW
jgi:hypothetical protein